MVKNNSTKTRFFHNFPSRHSVKRRDLSPERKGHMLTGVTRRNVLCSVWLCKSLFRLKHTSVIQTRIHALMPAANGTNNSVHLSDFHRARWCWQFLWRSLKNSNDLKWDEAVCVSVGIRRAGGSPCINVLCKHSFRFSGLKWLWVYDRFYWTVFKM